MTTFYDFIVNGFQYTTLLLVIGIIYLGRNFLPSTWVHYSYSDLLFFTFLFALPYMAIVALVFIYIKKRNKAQELKAN